jgi:hypothetical protein
MTAVTLAAKRRLAGILAVAAAYQGVWAAAFPRSFYDDFPGPGLHWVAALGPYNEHLAVDVGALNLSLFVLSAWAVRRPTRESLAVTGGAWLVYDAIHFWWHMRHLHVFATADKIGVAGILGGLLLLSVLMVLPVRSGGGWDQPRSA